ncbi:DUF4012 domain-containing protein [candidate division WWE3 bacterium]|nr:DUF4012 domain-containing protein [candidate division WWE3 bacterium]
MATKFWQPKKPFDLKSLFNFGGKNKISYNTLSIPRFSPRKMSFKFNLSLRDFYKRIGLAGAVTLSVVGILVLLTFFFVVKPAYSVLAGVNGLKRDWANLRLAFKNQDIEGINQALADTRTDLENLRSVRDKNFGWARNLPASEDYYSDSEYFINAGLYAVDGLTEFVVVVQPFADAAGFKYKTAPEVVDPNSGSGLAEAFASWVGIMPSVADKMDGVIEKFDKVGDEMIKVDPGRYPESFRGVPIRSNIEAIQQYMTKSSEFGPDIKAALNAVPPMLGVNGEKRYAIIMQNDAELRPTGGFWTNYATFRVNNAMLTSDFTSKDMYSIDEIIALTDTPYTSPFPKPLPPYRDFLKVEHTYARDANISPDFVTSIDSWLWYYKFAGRIMPLEAKPINGVFAMDTQVVKELLAITGPVQLDGVDYSADNVVLELEKLASLSLKEQQGRKKVLGDLMEGMLLKMYQSEKNLWPKFTETALRLASQKHLMAYVFDDPKAQELLEKYNFAGRIIDYADEDYSFVVSTNLAGDKTNIFITKDVDHKIYQENGKWLHDVSISYNYGQPKPGFEPLVAVYRDWVRVYAPGGSKLVSLEGSDAKTESDTGEERGKVYFAGHLTLPPNESKTIKFKYEIPPSVIKGGYYKVYLQKQAGTNADKHSVTINGKTQTVDLLTDKTLSFKID